MDISDVNFKPCPCGYQVRSGLDSRRPSICSRYPSLVRFVVSVGTTSRKTSTAGAPLVGVNTPTTLCSSSRSTRRSTPFPRQTIYLVVVLLTRLHLAPFCLLSHKRLTQQKKQRERERKELDALGRRNLANVRVVQRNVVYVVGIGPRFAKEEVRSLPCSPPMPHPDACSANSSFLHYARTNTLGSMERSPRSSSLNVRSMGDARLSLGCTLRSIAVKMLPGV